MKLLLPSLFLFLQPFQANCFVVNNAVRTASRHKLESQGSLSTTPESPHIISSPLCFALRMTYYTYPFEIQQQCLKMGMEHLQVGSEAPPFTVKDQDGTDVTLASFKGQKNVIVYFYPKDATSGCTMEASKFRDLKSEYDSMDCVVLGVSADDEVSHTQFIADLGLNFSLLADTNKELIKAYGAVKEEDESKIQRSTVLINKAGKIAAVWFPVKGAEQHPVEVLENVKVLSSSA